MGVQNTRICLSASVSPSGAAGPCHNGSARGYQELFVPLAIPATAEQTYGQAVYLCSAALGATACFCRDPGA
jgi:hypothetical protein